MAELQIAIWRQTAAKSQFELTLTFYEIFEQQYQIPPVSSLKMALDASEAVLRFSRAPDSADQEKALLPLQMVFAALKKHTKSTFDSDVVARMELNIWMLRADNAQRAQLSSALSDQLALIYNQSSAACLPASKKLALALKLVNEGKWTEAQISNKEGWIEIKKLANTTKR